MSEAAAAVRALKRLGAEKELMYSLRRAGKIDVEGVGKEPYKTYKVTIYGKTYVKPRDEDGEPELFDGPHVFRVEARANYPLKEAPVVTFTTRPPAHINVFRNSGQVCIGHWNPTETLASETMHAIRVLFLDPSTFNFNSMADSSCKNFCSTYSGGVPGDFPIPCPAFGCTDG